MFVLATKCGILRFLLHSWDEKVFLPHPSQLSSPSLYVFIRLLAFTFSESTRTRCSRDSPSPSGPAWPKPTLTSAWPYTRRRPRKLSWCDTPLRRPLTFATLDSMRNWPFSNGSLEINLKLLLLYCIYVSWTYRVAGGLCYRFGRTLCCFVVGLNYLRPSRLCFFSWPGYLDPPRLLKSCEQSVIKWRTKKFSICLFLILRVILWTGTTRVSTPT